MKRLIVLCTMLALMLAAPAFAACPPPDLHCPAGGTKYEGNYNATVLPAGTVFCVKAGAENSDYQTADGTTPLSGYVTWTVGAGNRPDVSYYVVYSVPDDPPPPVCEWDETLLADDPACVPPDDPEPPEEPTPPPCQPVHLYDLYRYRMENAPDWYFGGGVCWIKSDDGVPGAERVIAQCSLQCIDETFVWEGTDYEFAFGVYLNCDGTVTAADPTWDPAWVDLPYAQGEPATCYNAGCP